MRVLHIVSGIDPKYGGPVAALVGLACAQSQLEIKVYVASTYASDSDMSQVEKMAAAGVNVHLIGPAVGPLFRHPQIASTLDGLVRLANIVHIHGLWEEIHHQAARAADRIGVPYIIRPCGMLDPWSLKQGWLKKKIYMLLRLRRNLKRAAAIHVATEMEGRMVARLGLKTPLFVQPNGVSLAEFEHLPPRGTFRARFPQLADRRYIIYLGRIHPGKGLELLIPAFAKLPDREIMLVIVGPDSDGFQATVQKMSQELGVADRVIFTGILRGADRVAALAEAELFALPSAHENFGIAVVEALAAGTPVVISDHVYIHEQITRGGVGGVAGLDVDEQAKELAKWIGNADLRGNAASRARAFVWENFDWVQIARRSEEFYDGLKAE